MRRERRRDEAMAMTGIPLEALEEELLEQMPGCDGARPAPALLVLGAPRTGSTAFYQALIASFRLAYFSNLTNDHFAGAPALGLAIQAGVGRTVPVAFASRYGKTRGALQPSEGSHVLRTWFGGGHPSQVVSTDILDGRAEAMRRTARAAHALWGRPLVIKNAWNCFRVASLSRVLPDAYFVWIRRDIAAAARSDLAARYVVQGSPEVWNSATPHNVETLRSRPYWEQVVENQYEYSAALGKALPAHAAGRFIEVWYEDFCAGPMAVLRRLGAAWPALGDPADLGSRAGEIRPSSRPGDLPGEDATRIDEYVGSGGARLGQLRYRRPA